MSLNLQLPPDLQAEIRQAAGQEGVDPEAFVVAAIKERVRRTGDADRVSTESRLLEQISAGLPPAIWQRYHELTAKRRDETLTDEEYPELLRLTDEVELWNARRLELLLELARLRGVPLRTLMEQMGLGQPPYA